jgi:hypothetical protein
MGSLQVAFTCIVGLFYLYSRSLLLIGGNQEDKGWAASAHSQKKQKYSLNCKRRYWAADFFFFVRTSAGRGKWRT